MTIFKRCYQGLILSYLLVENEKAGLVGEMKYDFTLDSCDIICYTRVWFCHMVINEMEQ